MLTTSVTSLALAVTLATQNLALAPGYPEPTEATEPALEEPGASEAAAETPPADAEASEPKPAPADPAPEGPAPEAQPDPDDDGKDHSNDWRHYKRKAVGIKLIVLGSVFLVAGSVLLGIGIPAILKNKDPDENGERNTLGFAGGIVATSFGGLMVFWAIPLLPTGIVKLTRANRALAFGQRHRASLAFGRTYDGTWTSGLRLRF